MTKKCLIKIIYWKINLNIFLFICIIMKTISVIIIGILPHAKRNINILL